MEYLILLWLFSVYTMDIQATTHWMVTETGLIQPKLDSPFEMARPFDLLAFLNQDTRWDNIHKLHLDIKKRQTVINKLWNKIKKETDVKTQLAADDNCVKAGSLNSLDWFTSHMEDGRAKIDEKAYALFAPSYGDDVDVPDCKKISSLTFSMFAFEHLEGMRHRENLTAEPENYLPELISPIMTVDEFGHWVAVALRRNSSSWLHYNLASLYWRARGKAPKALECSRRSVHYAPRRFKDIPLFSMGSVLFRSKAIKDGITILNAAVDHDPQFSHHFVLANAYAVYGDFNSSLRHLKQSLHLNSKFDLARRHTNAVLCHAGLVKKMEAIKKVLSQFREELSEYSIRKAHWLTTQAAFLKTMKHEEEYDYRNVENNCIKMTEITGLNIKDLKKEGDKNSLIQYFLDGPLYNPEWLEAKGVHAIDSAYSLQRLIKYIDKHANSASDFVIQTDHLKLSDGQIVKEISPIPAFPEGITIKITAEGAKKESHLVSDAKVKKKADDDYFEFETGLQLYPPTLKLSRNTEDFDREPDWPSNRLCKETAPNFPENVEAIFPVFLPFENKGIRLKSLLTDKIGVPTRIEHELPWHPPTCPQDKDAAAFTQKKSQKQQLVSEVVHTDYLKQKLLEYVDGGDMTYVKNMQDAEIGQRICTAMQMKVAPKWVIYTVSSLYWRVRGNNMAALNCLLTGGRTVPARYKDVVLASLASVYLEMGYFDEALAAAEDAFRMSLYEPATNFILAELNMIKKHRNTHMFHLKQVLRVEPGFMGGLARNLLNGWACILKQVNTMHELGKDQDEKDLVEGDICTQVESGMSMVCENDGSNCHMTNIQCFSSSEKDTSTLVRMLELKDDSIQQSTDLVDDSIFDTFIERMPKDKSDRAAHHDNFNHMIRTIDKALKGCGPRGCSSMQPEDLSLSEEDCTHHHLQLGYWLHIISFRQLLSDSTLRLPAEIPTMTPSNKKIPECRIYLDPSEDFYIERLSRVETEGWEPVLSLMHQFAEMFHVFDYVTLGAKITRYVDSKPRSWLGALGAGWWCGAGGRGACAVRCLSAAYALAPPQHALHALRALAALLHIQSKQQDAKDVAYLSFYMSPKSKTEAFLVAVSHTYLAEYEQAVWMYRYALSFDDKYLPAKACLHATMCLLLFGDKPKHN